MLNISGICTIFQSIMRLWTSFITCDGATPSYDRHVYHWYCNSESPFNFSTASSKQCCVIIDVKTISMVSWFIPDRVVTRPKLCVADKTESQSRKLPIRRAPHMQMEADEADAINGGLLKFKWPSDVTKQT